MKERTSGYNTRPQNFDTVPTRGWSDPSRRDAFEEHFRTPVGGYGYEFNSSQYPQVLAVDLIGDGVAAELNKEFDGGYRSIRHEQFDNPDGTFSRGVILLGASSRELAERGQPQFEDRVNAALEALGANVRLGTHTE